MARHAAPGRARRTAANRSHYVSEPVAAVKAGCMMLALFVIGHFIEVAIVLINSVNAHTILAAIGGTR